MLLNNIKKWFHKKPIEVDNITADIIDDNIPPIDRLQEFVRNPVWKYITDTIAYRIKASRDDLENQEIDIETVRVFQGRIEELRFIESIPRFLIEQYSDIKAEVEAKKEAKK